MDSIVLQHKHLDCLPHNSELMIHSTHYIVVYNIDKIAFLKVYEIVCVVKMLQKADACEGKLFCHL